MKIDVKRKVGRSEFNFHIDETDEMEAFHKAIVLSSPRGKCDSCGNYDPTRFKYTSNKDGEGHTYVNFMCLECGAVSKLGRYKTGGYFWKNFELYKKHNFNDSKPKVESKTKKSDTGGGNDFFSDMEE